MVLYGLHTYSGSQVSQFVQCFTQAHSHQRSLKSLRTCVFVVVYSNGDKIIQTVFSAGLLMVLLIVPMVHAT